MPFRSRRSRRSSAPEDPRSAPRSLLRQSASFAAIGILSTAVYVALFLALRTGMGAQGANFAALLATAVLNTAANRRFTFGIRGRAGAARQQCEGLMVFGVGLALTSGALALSTPFGEPSRPVEVVVLVTANLLATALRFVLLRGWVFHPRRTSSPVKESRS